MGGNIQEFPIQILSVPPLQARVYKEPLNNLHVSPEKTVLSLRRAAPALKAKTIRAPPITDDVAPQSRATTHTGHHVFSILWRPCTSRFQLADTTEGRQPTTVLHHCFLRGRLELFCSTSVGKAGIRGNSEYEHGVQLSERDNMSAKMSVCLRLSRFPNEIMRQILPRHLLPSRATVGGMLWTQIFSPRRRVEL